MVNTAVLEREVSLPSDADRELDTETEIMWNKCSLLPKLVAHAVKVSEAAGNVIKTVMAGGDLQIVHKNAAGEPADVQTEADRRAQYCIVTSLQSRFPRLKIIGEEDVTSVVPLVETSVDPSPLIFDDRLSADLRNIKEEDVVVWVDPLDGTSEVALALRDSNSALLEQVTVLIGIAVKGTSVAGVIHQPYYKGNEGRTVWAMTNCGVHGLTAVDSGRNVVLTTRSHLNEGVLEALNGLASKGLADEVLKVGGAGYKVLRVLEGCAAYVFASAGCKKWDTCAPEAILHAAGGRLTDISGRSLKYHEDVQLNNTGGVLATASWVKHEDYLRSIPEPLRNLLPEFSSKK